MERQQSGRIIDRTGEHNAWVRTGADGRFSAAFFDFGEAGFLSRAASGYPSRVVPVEERDLDLGDIYLSPYVESAEE